MTAAAETPPADRAAQKAARAQVIWVLAFDIFMLGLMLAFFLASLELPRLARYFPLFAAGAGLLFGVLNLGSSILLIVRGTLAGRSRSTDSFGFDDDDEPEEGADGSLVPAKPGNPWIYVLWFVAFILGIYVLGIKVATAAFLVLWLWRVARSRWPFIVGSVACVIALLQAMEVFLDIRWPESVLF